MRLWGGGGCLWVADSVTPPRFTIDIWERMKLSDYNEYRVYATDQEVLAAVSSGVADIGMAAISITVRSRARQRRWRHQSD